MELFRPDRQDFLKRLHEELKENDGRFVSMLVSQQSRTSMRLSSNSTYPVVLRLAPGSFSSPFQSDNGNRKTSRKFEVGLLISAHRRLARVVELHENIVSRRNAEIELFQKMEAAESM